MQSNMSGSISALNFNSLPAEFVVVSGGATGKRVIIPQSWFGGDVTWVRGAFATGVNAAVMKSPDFMAVISSGDSTNYVDTTKPIENSFSAGAMSTLVPILSTVAIGTVLQLFYSYRNGTLSKRWGAVDGWPMVHQPTTQSTANDGDNYLMLALYHAWRTTSDAKYSSLANRIGNAMLAAEASSAMELTFSVPPNAEKGPLGLFNFSDASTLMGFDILPRPDGSYGNALRVTATVSAGGPPYKYAGWGLWARVDVTPTTPFNFFSTSFYGDGSGRKMVLKTNVSPVNDPSGNVQVLVPLLPSARIAFVTRVYPPSLFWDVSNVVYDADHIDHRYVSSYVNPGGVVSFLEIEDVANSRMVNEFSFNFNGSGTGYAGFVFNAASGTSLGSTNYNFDFYSSVAGSVVFSAKDSAGTTFACTKSVVIGWQSLSIKWVGVAPSFSQTTFAHPAVEFKVEPSNTMTTGKFIINRVRYDSIKTMASNVLTTLNGFQFEFQTNALGTPYEVWFGSVRVDQTVNDGTIADPNRYLGIPRWTYQWTKTQAGASRQEINSMLVTPSVIGVGSASIVGASASSGLAVQYNTTTPSVCYISGNFVVGLSAGVCEIVASQPGNADYFPAPTISKLVTVSQGAAMTTLPLSSSLLPSAGNAPVSLIRASDATVVDYSGALKSVKQNWPRFEGGRLTENHISTQDMTLPAWQKWQSGTGTPPIVTQSGTMSNGRPAYRVQMNAGAGTLASDFCQVIYPTTFSFGSSGTISFLAKSNTGLPQSVMISCAPYLYGAEVVIGAVEKEYFVTQKYSSNLMNFEISISKNSYNRNSQAVDILISECMYEDVTNLADTNPSIFVGDYRWDVNHLSGTKLACYGDSLTHGNGVSPLIPYGEQIARAHNWPSPDIRGVDGETSTQILNRLISDITLFNKHVIIWAGRNNYYDQTTILADIAAMVAAVGHTNYLVLSIINGDTMLYITPSTSEYIGGVGYSQIQSTNLQLSATYGARFVDVTTPLINAYNSSVPQDVIDFANGVPPSSLRYDWLHLNSAGYEVVANTVFAAGAAVLGWTNGAYVPVQTLPELLVEPPRTNHFLYSSAPMTQESLTLAVGTYTVWLSGFGTVAVAAGTATLSATGAATYSSSFTFDVTSAGTVIYTVSGLVNFVQAEDGPNVTSYIATGAVPKFRDGDMVSVTSVGTIGTIACTISLEWTPKTTTGAIECLALSKVDTANWLGITRENNTINMHKSIAGVLFSATVAMQIATGTKYKVCGSCGAAGVEIVCNGSSGTSNPDTSFAAISQTVEFGHSSVDSKKISNINLQPTQASLAEMIARTL
jgi:lysophospholipase L1-like esterase